MSVEDRNAPSDIFRVEWERWRQLSREEKQRMYAAGPIVIPSGREEKAMTLEALREIGDLDCKYTVHPASLLHMDQPHAAASLKQLWDETRRNDGAIMNALALPPVTSDLGIRDLQSDEFAVRQIHGPETAISASCIPTWATNWTICATSDAYHEFHVDTQGVGTCVQVQDGVKIWVIWCLKNQQYTKDISDLLQLFEEQSHWSDAGVSKLKSAEWQPVVLVLRTGDLLIMPPNVPHFVVTSEDSVAYGLHFYSTSTIRQSCIGICCTLVRGRYITNNYHIEMNKLLVSLLGYWLRQFLSGEYFDRERGGHLVDVTNIHGLNDLIIVLNVMDLGSLLWIPRYFQPLTPEAQKLELLQFKYAAQTFHWVYLELLIKDSEGKAVDLIQYRKARLRDLVSEILSELKTAKGGKDVTFSHFKKGLTEDFVLEPHFLTEVLEGADFDSISTPQSEIQSWVVERDASDRNKKLQEFVEKEPKLAQFLP
ncbi:hypothetical protein VKT23_007722 [Stygiomarasmius scandens]|uniref:JmjC domain-containing protein n=1 Tax=Marasmiellus scandens TaxID=2682957 RepID=A0ABR1JI77_9AGAR